jgi:hypothetical protein
MILQLQPGPVRVVARGSTPVRTLVRVAIGPQGAPGSGGSLQYLDMVADDGHTYRLSVTVPIPGATPTWTAEPTPIA